MKKIEVAFTATIHRNSSLEEITSYLDSLEKHEIEIAPWSISGARPTVRFSIAHTGDCILLKYEVTEEYTPPVYLQANDPVYKDSCVEFFIAPDAKAGYYNFEFNSLGTCLMGYGNEVKSEREYQPASIIDKIRRSVLIEAAPAGNDLTFWQLTLAIPVEAFTYHDIKSLEGKQCSANFYKCGDDLPNPHFLAWNDIKAPEPNFHLPQFFGGLSFRPGQE